MSQAPPRNKLRRETGKGPGRRGRASMVPFELVTSLWQGLDKSVERPRVLPLAPPASAASAADAFGYALTVDVEEWYHTCQVPGYVHPERRPLLRTELDRVLPEILEMFGRAGRRATF